jgi:hypothetical protein
MGMLLQHNACWNDRFFGIHSATEVMLNLSTSVIK